MKPLVSQLWPQFMADPDFAACFGQVIVEHARMLRPAPISHGKTLRAHRHKNVPSCIPSISFHLPYVRVDGHKRIQAIVSALEQCPRRQMHFPL